MKRVRLGWFVLLLVWGSVFMPASVPKGALCIIGGAQKSDNAEVYREMIRLAGGVEQVKIAVIAAGSIQPVGTFRDIVADFELYGVKPQQIRLLPIAMVDDPETADCDESGWKANGFSADLAVAFSDCNLIYFSGGDQIRYQKTLLDESGKDSPVLTTVRKLYENGAVIAGTSAGAAMMSDPMILEGSSLGSLTEDEADRVKWGRGLGFWPGVVVDQHFIKRGRLGRLLVMLLQPDVQPGIRMGFGVDEDTALLIHGGEARVLGRSGVLIVDVGKAVVATVSGRMRITGGVLHYLHHGDAYSLVSGKFSIGAYRHPIEKGKEYYDNYPDSADVFGRDVIVELITRGLADCRRSEIFGLAFDASASEAVPGIRLKFYKTDATKGYLGETDGEESYSVLNLGLDCEPVVVHVEKLH